MAKVFSWKVAPGKYSYLFPENGSYIRSRVTDPQTLHDMANEVDTWSEEDYRSAYEAMQAEVNSVYGSLNEPYSTYYTIGGITDGTVVLLSGKDGSGGGLDGEGGGNDPFLDEKDYKELERKIREEFDKYKNSILAQVEEIRNAIENMASASIGDALAQLAETRDMLANLRRQMEAAASTAQQALDAARSLANSGEDITPEMLEAILGMKQEVGEWMDRFDGKIRQIITDYDKATQDLGLIGYGADPARGVFSFMAENINTLNGTVGTAGSEWNASSGVVRDFATWFEESDSSYAEIVRMINAKRAEIQDVIDYINGSDTTRISQRLNAQIGEVLTELDYGGGDGTTSHVEQKLNVLSGVVATSIARYDALSGRVVSINNSMDGMQGTVEQAMTIANIASGTAKDLRELWDEQKGILQTVSDLIIKEDTNGDPIYWYVGASGEQKVRVWLMEGEEGELPKYNTAKDGSGTEYTENVLPDYMSTMLSYIQQNSNAIDFGVSSGDIISALRLTVTEDGESIIYGLADKVLLDSHVIASSLTATAANIGGVHIGAGMISAQTGDNKWALRGDGILEATGAEIAGHITATSLTLADGAKPDVDGMVTVDHWVGDEDGDTGFMVSSDGLLQAKNAIIQGTVAASDILLNGKSLKLNGNDNENKFTIGNDEIEVKHVPTTIDLAGVYEMVISWSGLKGYNAAETFCSTGDTTITLPKVTATYFRVQKRDASADGECSSTLKIAYAVFSATTESSLYDMYGDFISNDNYDTCSTAVLFAKAERTLTIWGTQWEADISNDYVCAQFSTLNTIRTLDGRYYKVVYKYKVVNGNGDFTSSLQIPDMTFINAPNPVNEQFFNIGKNGMQIFLGNGFYFTAANDRSLGPIIAMGGLKNGTKMVGLKIDTHGIQVLDGSGDGWRNL